MTCLLVCCVDIRNGSDDDLPPSAIASPPVSMEGTLVFLLRKLVEKRREGHRPEELSVSVVRWFTALKFSSFAIRSHSHSMQAATCSLL